VTGRRSTFAIGIEEKVKKKRKKSAIQQQLHMTPPG
jgi:hypothetical protein